jgi:circadian clock protein KaiC
LDTIKTGITGFDKLLEKGVPRGSAILVSGGAGTGKTIFSMQFIYEGAKQFKEPGLFVTLETNLKNITWNMESFQWDIKSLQDQNLIKIYRLNLDSSRYHGSIEDQIDRELEIIASMVEEYKAKRIVIDTTTALGVWIKEEGNIRRILYKFCDALKNIGCTTLLTSETKYERNSFSAFGVEEFVSDSIVRLYFSPPHRSIFIRKMRGTDHSKSLHPFEITKKGIEINPKDEIMWDAIK